MIVTEDKRNKLIRFALIQYRDEVKEFLQGPLMEESSKAAARQKLSDLNSLIAEYSALVDVISPADKKPEADELAPATTPAAGAPPYVVYNKNNKELVRYYASRSIWEPTVERGLATRFNTVKLADWFIFKHNLSESWEVRSLSDFDTLNQ